MDGSFEDRIGALEAAAGVASASYAPLGGMTVSADGTIAYDFNGHILAQGLDMLAGDDSAAPTDRRIRWLNGAGQLVAEVWSWFDANAHSASAVLQAQVNGRYAGIQADIDQTGLGEVVAYANGKTDFITSSTGGSSFVRAAAGVAPNLALDGGPGSITITNGSWAYSGAVFHNLGRQPTAVIATPLVTADTRNDWLIDVVQANASWVQYSIRGAAAEQFAVANPTAVPFYWLAFG